MIHNDASELNANEWCEVLIDAPEEDMSKVSRIITSIEINNGKRLILSVLHGIPLIQ
ncbi:hypothetical protein ABKP99_09135 [Mammaliicoccus sciuri]